jgi:hypothetical protein
MTERNPIDRPHQRQADPGVARRPLDDGAAGAQRPPRHRIADDEKRGAVLDRLAGVQKLGLAQNLAARRLRGAAQPDQRGVADGIGQVLAYHDRSFRRAWRLSWHSLRPLQARCSMRDGLSATARACAKLRA